MERKYFSNKARDITKVLIIALPGLAGLVKGEQVYASQDKLFFSPNYRPQTEESAPMPKDRDQFQYTSLAILPEQIRVPVKNSEERYHR